MGFAGTTFGGELEEEINEDELRIVVWNRKQRITSLQVILMDLACARGGQKTDRTELLSKTFENQINHYDLFSFVLPILILVFLLSMVFLYRWIS